MNKNWVIIGLIMVAIFLITYLFVYPYLMEKMLRDAMLMVVKVIIGQVNAYGEVKITIEGVSHVLIDKSRCEKIVNKTV